MFHPLATALVSALISYLCLWRFPSTALLDNPANALPTAITSLFLCQIVLAIVGAWDSATDLKPEGKQKNRKQQVIEPRWPWISSVMYGIWWTVFGTITFWLIAVLFGAPVFELVEKTWLAAAYLSVLAVFPTGAALKSNTSAWIRLISSTGRLETAVERMVYYPLVMSVVGAWFGGFVIPLDWQRDWQKWPVPIVCGAFFGSFAGHSLSVIFNQLAS
ncbi:uncharacterized protein SPPG_09103 [Spizellomyces punctatus DAOM BR117]|uniref:Glycosylphosphatidylinositol anchor biosynthesis protein 11 n=1 Tax=Spizellomyces punctatus (strain DAOM BR117) TaxID=645134 RepID=A0A0L0HKP9_SPIPD|nr:uncharacterized protein SPPG_09103 [Spizellomyces punctatus DAOM BR117]KND01475.1 hypothetical protein SPPG_09103 [Spizellomyces punctatus DAOM BR117]|eukprot:XP_016609514.1 hypothetical protein SPPG_09103 [Spizellomyces punctatus DAOM BR117]